MKNKLNEIILEQTDGSEERCDFEFCTYITFYAGEKLPPFYIGHSSVKNILEKGYNGSPVSKKYKDIWMSERINNKNLFSTHILTKHSTRAEANLKESDIQHFYDAPNSPLFINVSFAQKGFFCGVTHSAETRAKMSETRKGMKHTEEAKKKIAAGHLGKPKGTPNISPESKAKISEARRKHRHTDETKAKISAINKGRIQKPLTSEQRQKISDALKGKKKSRTAIENQAASQRGKKCRPKTEEEKIHLSKVLTGRKMTEESKKKMSEAATGKKHNEESKKKMSENRKGKKWSDKMRESIAKTNAEKAAKKPPIEPKGPRKKMSDEARANISQAHLGKKASEETKLKMSIARTGRKNSDEVKDVMRLARLKNRGYDYVLTKGDEYHVVSDLVAFCKERSLNPGNLTEACRRGRIHKKSGWSITRQLTQ